jgi:hypothetical protein
MKSLMSLLAFLSLLLLGSSFRLIFILFSTELNRLIGPLIL